MLDDIKKTLWATADKLRANMDAAEYKHLVLGLIFVKYISDTFQAKRAELTARFADPADEYFLPNSTPALLTDELEDRDYYREVNVFWVPEAARWEALRAAAKQPDIGKRIDDALSLIEAENPKLKGILDKRFARAQLPDGKLGELVDLVSTIGFGATASEARDVLGQVYEYFLGMFASAEGKRGGQFYTPRSIVKTLVAVLAPHHGKVYDPCCGSGGMFVQSEEFILSHGGKLGDVAIFGQEANPTTWRLAAMNLAIRGIDFNLGREPADTGKLLVVRVHEGDSKPYGTAAGLFKQRVGKNCMPLDPVTFQRAQVRSAAVDWSGAPANGLALQDLDPLQIERARQVLRSKAPASGLLELPDPAFLSGLEAMRDGQVTHAGMLLFARREVLAQRCPQARFHYVLHDGETSVARNDIDRLPLLEAVERMEQVFTGPLNPEKEIELGLFKLRIPQFPVEGVREAVLNALTHRDYQFEHLRELTAKFGRIPPWEANNHAIYPATSFAAQVLSIMEAAPRQFSRQLRRRVHGAFKNPDDMRGLRLELSAATHFARRARKLAWPEMTGEGTFDLLVQDVGPRGLEIECKAISEDKGRKIHKREVLDFYRLLLPHIQSTIKGLSTGLSAVLTVPARLPSQHADRVALARQYGSAIFAGGGVALPDGSSVRIAEFDVARLGDIPSSSRPSEVRAAIDEVTETNNRQAMVIGTQAGGALALTVQSRSDDTFMKAVFDTLSDSAKRQLSGIRGGMFLVGFHGIDGGQLLSVAGQDQDAAQSPTALRLAVSRFLASTGRDQVVGVGFLSESALNPVQDGLVESGGTAYYFPKRESPLWSEDFSGLFQWMATPVDQAP